MTATRRGEFYLEPTLCRGLVEAAVISLRSLAIGSGLRLRLEPADDDIEARVDRRAFAQIVRDLIASAIRHAGDGEIRVSISAGRPDGRAWIAIGVSIPGLRPDDQARFPWAALNGSRELAEALGGRIELRRDPVTGSALALLLPAN